MMTRRSCVASAATLLLLALGTQLSDALTDADFLNLLLNLEYLEANFYSCATTAKPIPASLSGGGPTPIGCNIAHLSPSAQAYATAIAKDEYDHVRMLRNHLGSAAAPQPLLDLKNAFGMIINMALNATVVPPFTPDGDDIMFYLTTFLFQDATVSAYLGGLATGFLDANVTNTLLDLLGAESYHAGAVRTILTALDDAVIFPYGQSLRYFVASLTSARSILSEGDDEEPLVTSSGDFNILPSDSDGLALARSLQQAIDIVTLGGANDMGGFFPNGFSGSIK